MKESKKLELDEWAQEHGLEVEDYDEAKTLKKSIWEWKYLTAVYAILAVLSLVFIAVTHFQAINNCVTYFNNESYSAAKATCSVVLNRVLS